MFYKYFYMISAQECLEMVKELEKVHGPVLHVVLPTLAIEHKGDAHSPLFYTCSRFSAASC